MSVTYNGAENPWAAAKRPATSPATGDSRAPPAPPSSDHRPTHPQYNPYPNHSPAPHQHQSPAPAPHQYPPRVPPPGHQPQSSHPAYSQQAYAPQYAQQVPTPQYPPSSAPGHVSGYAPGYHQHPQHSNVQYNAPDPHARPSLYAPAAGYRPHPQTTHEPYRQPPQAPSQHAPLPTYNNAAAQQHPGHPVAAYGPYLAVPPTVSSWTPSGRKKALLIGINYTRVGGQNKLRGCVNDVKMMRYLLISKFGFRDSDFWVMTDDPAGLPQTVRTAFPTKATMLDGMRWLVRGAAPGDSLFFQFSGHGGQIRDTNGDEEDGYDETILPVDHRTAGSIVDDQILAIMVRPLPAGSRLTAVMDCCHSGTAMDLPYIYLTTKDPHAARSEQPYRHRERGKKMPKLLSMLKDVSETLAIAAVGPTHIHKELGPPRPVSEGEVILFSGCLDYQTSADTSERVATGAMTFSLIEAIEHGSVSSWQNYTYRTLCSAMREKMRMKRMTQIPQLSTSRPFDVDTPFRL